jgi:hypothetical protein
MTPPPATREKSTKLSPFITFRISPGFAFQSLLFPSQPAAKALGLRREICTSALPLTNLHLHYCACSPACDPSVCGVDHGGPEPTGGQARSNPLLAIGRHHPKPWPSAILEGRGRRSARAGFCSRFLEHRSSAMWWLDLEAGPGRQAGGGGIEGGIER